MLSLARSPLLAGDWVYDGTSNGDEMGYAVATAGDVDGDGYDDLVTGAPGATDLVSREGIVSLFHGGPEGLEITPSWHASSGQKGARFGAALAAAGDLNGDGYGDLVVGSPEYNNGTSKAGAAMVFYGSPGSLSPTPNWTFVSPYREANLGHAVAGGGDLDGDGHDDLIVGSRWYSDTLSKEGAVLIFYGSEHGLPAGPNLLLVGGQAGASLGHVVAGGGDVNGDGYDDLLAGAPFYDHDEPDEGAAFLHLGGPAGLAATPHWTAYGGEEGAWFGASAAWAGDVNGDGYDDLAVGAPGDTLHVDRGRVHVYYGSPSGPGPLPNTVILSGQPLSSLGTCLARPGDMNGDGYDDLLAGAYRQEDDQRQEGAAFLYFGSPTGLHSTPRWVGWGDKAEAGYGFAVGPAGMVNATGFPAIAVGAPTYKLDRDPIGRAFVHYGPLEPRAGSYIWLPLIVHQVVP